jgi:outer membrane protein TolC
MPTAALRRSSRDWAGAALAVLVLLSPWRPVAAQSAVAPDGTVRLLDAVRAAIAQHPAIEIQRQQVAISEAVERQLSAPFDQVFATNLDRRQVYTPASSPNGFGLAPASTAQVGASYSKLLRNGVSLGGTVDMQRQIKTAASSTGLTTSATRLQVGIPLARGRGVQVTTANERAAGLAREGEALDLRHVTATAMTRVAASYWGLVAAERSRAVAAASDQRGEQLVENTRTLIAADQSPRAELALTLANAADRRAARFAAEQDYVAARQRLMLDMGLPRDQWPESISLDDFSVLGQLPTLDALPRDAGPWIDEALRRRADYLAEETRVAAGRVSREAATNATLPQVDFILNVGYTALAEGRGFNRYFSSLLDGVEGMDAVGRISYRFPLGNSQARGQLAEADAQLQQATTRLADIERTIRSSIAESYSAVRYALLGLAQTRESVSAFEDALRGEQDKLALGIGSIVNLLTIEDRLTTASGREVAAWRRYAQALVDFRFATGTLIPAREALPVPDLTTFTTLPGALVGGK